jgi:bifunctional non-homologous end joining protein LigD
MGLEEYNRKRNFKITSEPPGRAPKADGKRVRQAKTRSFVIQKHAASHLHYDFRLELEGVLKSWSIPKGPSLDPTVKRLAMQTEDHPIAYGSFEGIIPKGQYGGGTVLLWDRGTWAPQGDAHKDFHAGNLKFVLNGEKLAGGFALIKVKGRGGGRGEERSWLLIKERDQWARPERELDVVEARPESVASQRSLEEIAAQESDVWHSKEAHLDTGKLEGARPAPLPPADAVDVRTPSVARAVPRGDDWLHEMEVEGERLVCRIGGSGDLRLLDAGGKDWTARLPTVVRAARLLPVKAAILDGQLTALLPDGSTSASALPGLLRAAKGAQGEIAYFAFDLLHLDGQELTGMPLEERKKLLRELLSRTAEPGPLRFTDHLIGSGDRLLAEAGRLGIRGIVSKRRDGTRQGKSKNDWRLIRVSAAAKTRKTSKTSKTPKATPAVIPKKGKAARPEASALSEVVPLTHPERVLFPDEGITKRDLAAYYQGIASWILPHVQGRPLSLVRCPEGVGGKQPCFYMKHAGFGVPRHLRRVKIQEKTKVGEYLVVDDLPGLLSLVQISILEIHPWGSPADSLEQPDRMIFDLDPDPAVPWERVVEAAHDVRVRLQALGLESFVKTTGGKGLHVVAPIAPTSWEDCFAFSQAVAEQMERDSPRAYLTNVSKALRKGKILVDYLRNNRGSTAVAAYSTRARAGATVSVPLTWDELAGQIRAGSFTVKTVPRRLASLREDPWADFFTSRQKLTAAAHKAVGLSATP